MTKRDPAEEIERLREEIRLHDRKYYVEAAPEISDLQYDRLMDRLARFETKHPELITPDSPTQRVGGEPIEALTPVEHRLPMLSIDNAYSVDELRKYFDRIAKLLPDEPIEWVVELKIDGVAAAVTYVDGVLAQAATRGNGRVGDDVTHNIRTVQDLPLRLCGDDLPRVLEARGEVYMTNSELVRLNERQSRLGEPPYPNTRNLTAGTIRMKDPRVAATRRLRMFFHGVGDSAGLNAATHIEFLEELRRFGLSPTPHVKKLSSSDAVVEYCETLVGRLHELDFEVDGLVIKVNRFVQRERLGSTSKSPRLFVAYKCEIY